MAKYLQYSKIAFVTFVLFFALHCNAQTELPQAEGERARYNVQIDFKKAYISGVCIMLLENNVIKASVVNEFGVSALDYSYDTTTCKVKIINVMGKMNKWYIKRVLKKDLKQVMFGLQFDKNTYENTKYSIKYSFEPVNEAKDNNIHNCEQ